MGLIGGIARTAVIAGTATAVSNRVSRRQANRWASQEQQQYEAAAYQQQAYGQPQYAQPPQYTAPAPTPQYVAPAPPPARAPAPSPAMGDDTVAELQKLAGLNAQGILSDAEFTAAKAKLLGL
jgi:hypothetical protein